MSDVRLIDANKLKEKLQARRDNGNDDFDKGYNIGLDTAVDLIDNAPTMEEEPTLVVYRDGVAYWRRRFEPKTKPTVEQPTGDFISREAVKNFINTIRFSKDWATYRADYGRDGLLDSIFTFVCNYPQVNMKGEEE